jgi:uncharacterized RDD family membrane protein YckC
MEAPWTALPPPEVVDLGAAPVPAGFWRRAAAVAVDVAFAAGLLEVARLAVSGGSRGLAARAFAGTCVLVVPAAYAVLAHGTGGQTLGKRLVGVRVVSAAGGPIGYPRALARYVAWWLSALPLATGFLLAAGRRDRRAVHDLLAGTRVVRAARRRPAHSALLS